MIKNRFAAQQLRSWFLFFALLIVVASVLYANRLASRLAQEERRKMEVWADATREFILADENTNVDFVSRIIEGNTTIPVIMTDTEGHYLLSRNVREPKDNVEAFYARKIARLRESQEPIEVRIDDNTVQYIYYEDSTLLRQLQYFPYIQFSVIFLFIIISIFSLYTVQRSEQNKVWVGLSKETAHQLGTPISSLLGWQELLQTKYPDDKLIPEMSKDISRLQTIAERFSKIGSEPELRRAALLPVIEKSVGYMQTRTSNKIQYEIVAGDSENVKVMMNEPLLQWVLENICKNAVDAMSGTGHITVRLTREDEKVNIDISDTGKGIRERDFNKVFLPGYTTKNRGWGLGLSLAKRIVEDYHTGRISVLQSELGKGTTFRIQMKTV